MKKKCLAALVSCLFAALLLGGCAMNLAGNVYRYSDASEYEGVVGDIGGFGFEDFSSIEIDWISGHVEIIRRTDEQQAVIRLNEDFEKAMKQEEYDKLSLRIRIKNGVLSVKYATSGTRIPSNFKKSLTVEIPASIEFEKIEVNTVSAKVTVGEISLDELKVNTVSGNVSLSDISAKDISVNTVSGSTTFLRTECSDISVDSTSGALRVEKTVFSDLEFDSTSGSSTIILPEETGFTCKFDTVSGRFSDEFGAKKSGKKYVFGDGAIKIEVDTTSGSLSLKKATD